MTPQELLDYCLAKPGAWEDEPWDGDVVVKVAEKIFVFVGDGEAVGVKCGQSREEADIWLERYPTDARVMSYIGRSGWNSLALNRGIPDQEILGAVDDSYDMVVSRLPKSRRPTDFRQ